ncbi:hypothetical protein ACN2WE_05185 [Streptomyces sp. cg28]|uniref:hypothetical protein n=1 Tax=Streptomyces sp. cg28 TaxID=3403457 RepID=UPI003B226B9A
MTVTTQTATVEELRERAIALGVESCKAERAGVYNAPVIRMALDAIAALQEVAGYSAEVSRQIDLRYATYLLSIHTVPGFEETIAFDGDLDHPENSRGEKIGLSGVAA